MKSFTWSGVIDKNMLRAASNEKFCCELREIQNYAWICVR